MLEAERVIFAAPVFFMSLCAQAKTLVDRGQCLWARKYILKKAPPENEQDRRALVIAVGGSRGKKQFESIRLTMKVYFDSLGINYWANLFVNQIDQVGDIEKHPSAMDEAFRLGSELVSDQPQLPDKPINIELF
jgi:multimeric flavodoxin WrbA